MSWQDASELRRRWRRVGPAAQTAAHRQAESGRAGALVAAVNRRRSRADHGQNPPPLDPLVHRAPFGTNATDLGGEPARRYSLSCPFRFGRHWYQRLQGAARCRGQSESFLAEYSHIHAAAQAAVWAAQKEACRTAAHTRCLVPALLLLLLLACSITPAQPSCHTLQSTSESQTRISRYQREARSLRESSTVRVCAGQQRYYWGCC